MEFLNDAAERLEQGSVDEVLEICVFLEDDDIRKLLDRKIEDFKQKGEWPQVKRDGKDIEATYDSSVYEFTMVYDNGRYQIVPEQNTPHILEKYVEVSVLRYAIQ